MPSGTLKVLASVAYLTNAAANVYNLSSALIYTIVYHIRLVNVTTGAATATLYIGATGGSAGGTEILKDHAIPAKSEFDLYYPKGRKMVSTDFLSGLANASSTVTVEVIGEQVVV